MNCYENSCDDEMSSSYIEDTFDDECWDYDVEPQTHCCLVCKQHFECYDEKNCCCDVEWHGVYDWCCGQDCKNIMDDPDWKP